MARKFQNLGLVLCSALLVILGCSKEPGPPPPLPVEQIPTALNDAYKNASQPTRDLVAKLGSSLQAKDYPAAYDAVQALGSVPESSNQQRALTARAMLTIYGLLQTAQSQGDQNASAALRYHQMTK